MKMMVKVMKHYGVEERVRKWYALNIVERPYMNTYCNILLGLIGTFSNI